jgi:transcriptional regulator with XRE-family HTH domain
MLNVLLRAKMDRDRLSSHRVAERIGVAHTTILRALRGEAIDLPTLVKIANFLGVRPSGLIDALPDGPADLSDQLALLLSHSPDLEAQLRNAVVGVKAGKLQVEDVREVLQFALFKLSGVADAKGRKDSGD